MISPGIDEITLRTRAWLKQMVDASGSIVYDLFPTIEDTEAIPNPLLIQDGDENPFPSLTVVHAGWRQIETEDHDAYGEVGIENRLRLIISRLLAEDDDPGVIMRGLQAKVATLFIQQRFHRPPVDHTAPTDTGRWFWRPADVASTGISLFKVTAASTEPTDPLSFGPGILLEQSVVEVIAQGSARSVQ